MPTNYIPSQVYDKYVALQKQLATNITNKGVTASQTELYDNLIDKVAQIENLKGEERTLENFTNALSEPKSIVQLEYPEPKNLFDINNPTYAALSKANTAFLPTIEDGVISFNTYYSQRGGSGFVIPVEPNTTITISFDSVGSDYWTEIMAVESILDNVAINIYKYPQFKNITKYTLTQEAGKHYILFILDGVNGYYTAKIKNLQIEKGATATPYEPYTKTLNAKLGSKNLFDETAIVNTTVIGLTMSTNSDGSHKLTGTLAGQRFEYFNKVKLSQILPQGTTVTVGGWYDVTPTDNYIGLVGYGSDNKILFQANAKASGEHLTTTLTADLVSVGIVVRCVASAIGDTVTFDNIKLQLELGSTATPYTPYISDFSTVNVTRCGKNLFDKSIAFADYNSIGGGYNGLNYYVGKGTTVTISLTETPTTGKGYLYVKPTAISGGGAQYWLSHSTQAALCNKQQTITSQDGYISIYMTTDAYNSFVGQIQIEIGSTATPYEPYQGQTYTSTPTGEVTGITNLYPTTTLLTDNAGVVFEQVTGGSYKEILPSTDKNGITKVYQPSVDSSIDSNIKPENIKKGVKILGILGTYDGN